MFLAKAREMKQEVFMPRINYLMTYLDIPYDGKFIGKLSKGMKQKINIIAALLHESKHLI